LLAQMRNDEVLRYTPVIVLTSASNADSKLMALELGATEFLAKPVDSSELVLRVRNSLVFKAYQDRLANEDSLTGLPNRRVFVERLRGALARLQGSGAAPTKLGLLHIGLDRFKQVNDTLGHSAGDALLAIVAKRLRQCTRRAEDSQTSRAEASLLSRLGGDEFGLLLPHIDSAEAADRVARRVLAAMAEPFEHNGKELFITPSIGISIYPLDGDNDETLLSNAGAAAEHAQRSGRNTFRFYSTELDTVSTERLSMETELRRAVERNQLVLHYQPKVDLRTGKVVGAEALVRWQHPVLGLIPPDRFIPIAEESGLIVSIGQWVFDAACAQSAAWRSVGLGDLKIAVNVSRHELAAGSMVPNVQQALARHGVAPGNLVIELTESMLVDHGEETTRQLDQLRALGLLLSIDDFGTGYSSMSYLRHFRVQELKIDRSFISGTPDDPTDTAIVRAITVLAHSLKMTVVAEGVETVPQREFLQSIGCDVYQGYVCSRPLPPEQFVRRVREIDAAV
jgi:diguanylate cyclase (GGDEF)-like protein